jgi:hypothetical protein
VLGAGLQVAACRVRLPHFGLWAEEEKKESAGRKELLFEYTV